MGPRHDVAPEPEETSGRIPICSGYEPERDTARGQDRKRRILQTRRSKRNSYHGGLVLLRSLGRVGQVEGGPVGSWVRVGTKPELAPSCPPKPADVAERKRQTATGRGGTGLPPSIERNVMAESDCLFRVADARSIQRPFGHEDDRALRLRPAKLLADRYEAWRRLRVQHGDKSGTGRADPEFAQKVYP